jgi:hypothetical protein
MIHRFSGKEREKWHRRQGKISQNDKQVGGTQQSMHEQAIESKSAIIPQ